MADSMIRVPAHAPRPRLPWSAFVAVGLLIAASQVFAQAWPARPVRLVVPYTPGGNTDLQARLFAEHGTRVTGQPFVVENRAGAGGAIATEFVARAAPDGYTLAFATTGQMAIIPHMQKINYDPLKDIAPVTPLTVTPFMLAVSPALPVSTLREFIDHAKARPGKLNYGSGGVGSVGHFAGAMFNARAGTDMAFLSYKGAAQATAALAADEMQMYFASYTDLVPLAKAGRIKLLGIASEQRHPQLPDTPAITEVLPGFTSSTWNGLLAPAGTPAAVLDRLAAECRAMTGEPATAAKLNGMGANPACKTPAEFTRQIAGEYAAFRDAARTAGIKPE